MKNIVIVSFLIVLAVVAGCNNDNPADSTSGPKLGPTGKDLLGLVDGRTLVYAQVDTIITWVPSYHVQETTGTLTVRISGSGDDWVISDDTVPVLNLKLSEPFVLHNGYWRKVGQSDALVYFTTPAVVLDHSVAEDQSWTGDVPVRTTDSSSFTFPFYLGYFGFHFSKRYVGQEQVIVTDYAGDAYRYDAELYLNAADSIPVATVIEHYAAGVGLVRQEFRASGFIRVISLRSRS